jgi:hypothetical protein
LRAFRGGSRIRPSWIGFAGHRPIGRCANSARAGLLDPLRGLRDRHPPIAGVRGIGRMIGVEIARDRDSRAPVTPIAILMSFAVRGSIPAPHLSDRSEVPS